jgi:hypothetical protein
LTFEIKWEETGATSDDPLDPTGDWRDAGPAPREKFVGNELRGLTSPDISVRVKSLESISYIALGVWGETAGCDGEDGESKTPDGDIKPEEIEYRKSTVQMNWMASGAKLLCEHGAIQSLIDILRIYCGDGESVPCCYGVNAARLGQRIDSFPCSSASGPLHDQSMGSGVPSTSKYMMQMEINHTLTILYTLVEVGRQPGSSNEGPLIQQAFGIVERLTALCLLISLSRENRQGPASLSNSNDCKVSVGGITHLPLITRKPKIIVIM